MNPDDPTWLGPYNSGGRTSPSQSFTTTFRPWKQRLNFDGHIWENICRHNPQERHVKFTCSIRKTGHVLAACVKGCQFNQYFVCWQYMTVITATRQTHKETQGTLNWILPLEPCAITSCLKTSFRTPKPPKLLQIFRRFLKQTQKNRTKSLQRCSFSAQNRPVDSNFTACRWCLHSILSTGKTMCRKQNRWRVGFPRDHGLTKCWTWKLLFQEIQLLGSRRPISNTGLKEVA